MYGFTITTAGLPLLARATAGEQLSIVGAVVGKGSPEGDPKELTALVDYVADATSSVPIVTENSTSMMVEYRNDMNGGLTQGFPLSEYGIMARIGSETPVMIYYGSLADHPQWVSPYTEGLEVCRYPVGIETTSELAVTLDYPAGAFATSQDVQDALAAFAEIVQEMIDATAPPKNHASEALIYGIGNDSQYGHLKLSNELNSESNIDGGKALTPSAMKAHVEARDPHPMANAVPVGAIMMWSGEIADIPARWALCDGTNGTPDLRNRFIVGAGALYTVGNTGGSASVALSVAQMPSHRHRVMGGGEGSTYLNLQLVSHYSAGYGREELLDYAGGNGSHENRPPYYALCFIMFKGVQP